MSGVRAGFNLEANHPASLVTKAPVSWKGEGNIYLLVRVFGVASADPAPGPELVLQTVPVTGSLSGLASTKAWGRGVGGGPLAVEQFAGTRGNSVSVWGEPTALSGAHPSVLWSAQGPGPGALSLPLLLTNLRGTRTISTNVGTEEAAELSSPS